MSTFLSEIHFWTTQEDVFIKHTDYGAFKYYLKKDLNNCYGSAKKEFCEKRSVLWHPTNKRQNKLKERLKELEEYLIQNKIIYYCWKDKSLQLLLSTGLLVNINVKEETGDITYISFDKQLSTKLQVNIICDGVIKGNQIICVCNDGHVLGHGGTWKDGWLLEGGPRRKLSCHEEWLVVWGKMGSEHPQPWSPLTKDHQRANVHLYWIGSRGPELLSYKNTDGEPLGFVISKIFKHTLICIEQKVSQRGAVSVELSSLELVGTVLKTSSITSVPLQTQVSCCHLSPNEQYLLIGCIDSTVALLDRDKGSTKIVKSPFIPTFCLWQGYGTVSVICNDRGQIAYYDTALNFIPNGLIDDEQSTTIDLTVYFGSSPFSVTSLNWDKTNLLVALEHGPILTIKHAKNSLDFVNIAQKYLSTNKVEKAISLLLSWRFGENAFFILQKIVSFLLKKPLTEDVAKHLQDALGCYHGLAVPLSTEIRHQYGGQVFCLTRRFFHQLVRAGMYEMAFLLAVDMGHHDLFMDLHYIAVKIGETEMAAAARAQATALISRCSSEDSCCSHSSCSQCSGTDNDIKQTSAAEPQISQYNSAFEETQNHIMSTNFNQDSSKTNSKLVLTEFTKLVPPRALYAKPPQVPANFRKISPPKVPNLPFKPSLPSLLNGNLGIPTVNSEENKFSGPTYTSSQIPKYLSNQNIGYESTTLNNYPKYSSVFKTQTKPHNFDTEYLNKITQSTQNLPESAITKPPVPFAPLLPSTSLNSSSQFFNSYTLTPSLYTNATKKTMPKVKFSDTVTAFIVPEIKRPIRHPPPPHLTDPQKELADSLPLCHPNEDYLKDFAPVTHDEDEEKDNEPPKIKVVHFGVV